MATEAVSDSCGIFSFPISCATAIDTDTTAVITKTMPYIYRRETVGIVHIYSIPPPPLIYLYARVWITDFLLSARAVAVPYCRGIFVIHNTDIDLIRHKLVCYYWGIQMN